MKKRECLASFFESMSKIEESHYPVLPDNDAKSLLMAVIVANQNEAPLNVSQAMQMRRIGSPAKNHRKINDLLDAGMIELTYDAGNRRTKFLVPTASAMKIFDEIAFAMAQAAKLTLSQEALALSEQAL
jgi:DNA-binding MarR family transcriptional regulator